MQVGGDGLELFPGGPVFWIPEGHVGVPATVLRLLGERRVLVQLDPLNELVPWSASESPEDSGSKARVVNWIRQSGIDPTEPFIVLDVEVVHREG